ncbi:MAG: fused MFS/spermidine synthase [Actinomycetota bacterium]
MRILFSATLFVSAALLFLAELIFARMILPLLGGTPAVWITAMLFFQAMLLAGYAYAHASSLRLGTRRQAAIHLAIALLPLLVLPIAVPEGWAPPTGGNPAPWLLALLLVALGLPFFVVSSTTPMLQRWFANTGHRAAPDPYFLYRASNLGSMVGLLAYPFLVEPFLAVGDQSRLWAAGYWVLLALTAACAVVVWRSKRPVAVTPPADGKPHDGDTKPLTRARRLRWLALAFVPSSLMLGVTVYLTTDLAPIPLLWVVPLSLYLLSFILVFSPRHDRLHRFFIRAMPFLVVPLVVVLVFRAAHLIFAPLYLATFFAAAMVCHGELAKDRPPAEHLTEFYLWIAAGGVLGGAFNALLAPLLFDSIAEFPVMLVAACLLRPRRAPGSTDLRRDLSIAGVLGLLVFLLSLAIRTDEPSGQVLWGVVIYGVAAVICFSFDEKPVRFALGLGGILLASAIVPLGQDGRVVYSARSFFGTYLVLDDSSGEKRILASGNTVHGAQNTDPDKRLELIVYYTPQGPAGRLFAAIPQAESIGVVGLGAGSMACFADEGDHVTFYEIDPEVVRIANDPKLFTFLRDCPGTNEVVLGDARLSLRDAPNGAYDVLVMDAFNSDAIPLHLMTREALQLYLSKLSDDGVLAFHISNRYLNVAPVLGDLAADAGVVAYLGRDVVTEEEVDQGRVRSEWVVMTRDESNLGDLTQDAMWERLPGDPDARVWTDDYSNLAGAFSF